MRDMTIDDALRELESLLPGVNYVVNFVHYRLPVSSDENPEQYITAALGTKAVVGGIAEITVAEMLTEVNQCLQWPGTTSSCPDETTISLPRLLELVEYVLNRLERRSAKPTLIWSFWLKDGHPFYPVQWVFAYVLAGL